MKRQVQQSTWQSSNIFSSLVHPNCENKFARKNRGCMGNLVCLGNWGYVYLQSEKKIKIASI